MDHQKASGRCFKLHRKTFSHKTACVLANGEVHLGFLVAPKFANVGELPLAGDAPELGFHRARSHGRKGRAALMEWLMVLGVRRASLDGGACAYKRDGPGDDRNVDRHDRGRRLLDIRRDW